MLRRIFSLLAVGLACPPALASEATPAVLGIPIEFLFATTLLGVALWHRHALPVAVAGMVIMSLYKITFTGFHGGTGVAGWIAHLGHEWVVLANLLGLLLGFAILARHFEDRHHFEDSHVAYALPRLLPSDWRGALLLLALVFVMSAFLDNIAAALLGGTVAAHVFRRRVHVGYLAAIVAASNAGGSSSVVGDTTTTMMWIDGVAPLKVAHAYVAALTALLVFSLIAARQQHALQPIVHHGGEAAPVDWVRLAIVAWILAVAIATNVSFNSLYPELADRFPFSGLAVWFALLTAIPLRRPEWRLLPDAAKGSAFLLFLVIFASMMPVEHLPEASWPTALRLGFVSAVFDNIPLTALALSQGGYDWGAGLYRRLRRLHDLVRLLRRGGPDQPVPRSSLQSRLAQIRLACSARLRGWLRRHAGSGRLTTAPAAQAGARRARRRRPGATTLSRTTG